MYADKKSDFLFPYWHILNALMAKYGCDIGLGARIGKDLVLPHHSGVVIHGNVKIGENVIIQQNTTIGEKESDSRENYLVVGDNEPPRVSWRVFYL